MSAAVFAAQCRVPIFMAYCTDVQMPTWLIVAPVSHSGVVKPTELPLGVGIGIRVKWFLVHVYALDGG